VWLGSLSCREGGFKEWTLTKTEEKLIKIDDVGSHTKSDSPPGARDGRQREEFSVPTVPQAKRPTAQPSDNDAEYYRDSQGLMRIERSGSATRLKMAGDCREAFMWVMGIETIPSPGNIWMRWHYSPVAMWGRGFVLQIRFEKGRILGLHRITQRTWVALQVGLKAPGKVKTKGRQKNRFRVQELDECDQPTFSEYFFISALAKEPV